ncbi:MAG: VWA domain-containing protein [candidate division Zixibacteria bacterium]|nr:VWA domain-containing protein [candidate division Zixibacteria bacterium]
MIKFSDKIFLYGLLIIPFLWILLRITKSLLHNKISAFSERNLYKSLTSNINETARKFKWALIIIACGLFVTAIAGPQLGTHSVMVKREGVDIIIAVDTSISMLAEDGGRPPNRITRAKYEIISLIDEKLSGDRVGIVAFAGDAFVQCPLTLDYSAAKLFLDILTTDLIPVYGTDLEKAIRVAMKAYKDTDKQQKVLILISDGENHEGDPTKAAEEAAELGIVIYAIGLGNPAGEPIPMRGKGGNLIGYKKDAQGNVVVSKLDDRILREIARASNGQYFHAAAGGNELDLIYDEIAGMEKKEFEGKLLTVYEERFQWPLVAGIILLSLEAIIPERKRKNGTH